jgi:ankyrin repeat protein
MSESDGSSPKSDWSDSTTKVEDMTFDQFIKTMQEGNVELYDIDDVLEAHPDYANGRDENGKTPLILAAEQGRGDAVDQLINPRPFAAQVGRPPAAYVVDVSITDNEGKTAAQRFQHYYKKNPRELDKKGVKFFLDIFEKAAKDDTRAPTPSTYDLRSDAVKAAAAKAKAAADKAAADKAKAEADKAKWRNDPGPKTGGGRKRKTRKARKTKKSTRRRA